MSFARISELLGTKNRQPKENNELTELIQDHVSENVIKDLSSKIEVLESKIEHLEFKMDSKIEVLESKIDAIREILDIKVYAINQRIDAINQRIDATNQRIDAIIKSNRWIIGLLIGFGTSVLAMLINIWLSIDR